MEEKRFNPNKLDKLNDPIRLKALPPEFIVKKVALENPKIIIDLGAGTGFFSAAFAEIYKQSRVYACDISVIMVNWMKENISPKYENIIPLKMEDNSVPLNTGIADFLFMINLHHELDSPEKTLNECFRLLKHKGKIAISDWKKEKTEHGPSIELRYSPNKIKEQLLVAGFTKINIHTELQNNYLITGEK
ncbi:MAG: class I SAM-dependent methyltransferase [Bacteroidales bacterium]|jgi:ubiquinone/menaquinone biosynthesis C-methylase UbiE|nr:class I SAM-dependent methyltransferase [Bacteroidales bacterium]